MIKHWYFIVLCMVGVSCNYDYLEDGTKHSIQQKFNGTWRIIEKDTEKEVGKIIFYDNFGTCTQAYDYDKSANKAVHQKNNHIYYYTWCTSKDYLKLYHKDTYTYKAYKLLEIRKNEILLETNTGHQISLIRAKQLF